MTRATSKNAESRMTALGVAPIFIEESVAAAACGMRLERFRAECPLPGIEIDRRRLLPLDEIKVWAFEWWRSRTGAYRAANGNIHDPDFEAALRSLDGARTPDHEKD